MMVFNDRKPWLAAIIACDGIHPVQPLPQAREIKWAARREHPGRQQHVTQWTCADCCELWYELVQAGGLLYIRRLGDGQDLWSPGMIYAGAVALWENLLNGRAH